MSKTDKAVIPANTKAEFLDSATSSTHIAAPVEASSIQDVKIVSQTKPLDEAEREQFKLLEDTIRNGFKSFSEVYEAFEEIHDLRLYREQYSTFEEYCRKVWNMSRSKGQRYVAFIKCVENLKCSQSATNEPLAIPVNEMQARKLASLKPEQQVEAAKNVAKKTKKPTAKDFDEEAEKFTDDEPRVQSYDIRDAGKAGGEKKAVVQSASVSVPLFDSNLVSLSELHSLIVQTYNDYNSSQDAKVRDGLRKLKAESKKWAEWEAKQSKQQEVA